MLRKGLPQKFSEEEWSAAKEEARAIMVERAKAEGTITYSELAAGITSIELKANDKYLFHMLGEISSEEDAEGRGMLTVVVVGWHDNKPGRGFFILGQHLGKDTTDEHGFWRGELEKVYGFWSDSPKLL